MAASMKFGESLLQRLQTNNKVCLDNKKHNDDEMTKNNRDQHLLSVNWAAVMLCGELIGTTSLSLPYALQRIGLAGGLFTYISMFIISYHFAKYLSQTYFDTRTSIKEALNLRHLRDPYPQLAGFVIGKKTEYLVAASIIISDFLGAAVLFLFPASMMVDSFHIKIISTASAYYNKRIWIILTALIITPFTWNDRLKDNTFVGVTALVAAVLGHVMLMILYLLSFWKVEIAENTLESEMFTHGLFSIGIMMTAIDGFDILPTLQEDMSDPGEYKSVLKRSYAILFLLTAPVMFCGYFIFAGHPISNNILIELHRTIHSGYVGQSFYYRFNSLVAYVTLGCFVTQVLTSMILQLNPTFQYMEKLVPCKDGFCWRRCCLRTSIVVIIAGFVEFAPSLLPLISIHGTLLYVILGIALPGTLYLKHFSLKHGAKKLLIIIMVLLFASFLVFNTIHSVGSLVHQVERHTLNR